MPDLHRRDPAVADPARCRAARARCRRRGRAGLRPASFPPLPTGFAAPASVAARLLSRPDIAAFRSVRPASARARQASGEDHDTQVRTIREHSRAHDRHRRPWRIIPAAVAAMPTAPGRSTRSRPRRSSRAMPRSPRCTSTPGSVGLTDAQLIDAAAQHIHAHSIGTIQVPIDQRRVRRDQRLHDVGAPALCPAHRHPRRPSLARAGGHQHRGCARRRSGDRRPTLLGQWRLPQRPFGAEMAVLFGIKTPTGATNERDVSGVLFEAEFQPGSGSWDPMFGFAFTQALRTLVVRRQLAVPGRPRPARRTPTWATASATTFAVSYRVLGYSNPGDPMNAFAHDAPAVAPQPLVTATAMSARPPTCTRRPRRCSGST